MEVFVCRMLFQYISRSFRPLFLHFLLNCQTPYNFWIFLDRQCIQLYKVPVLQYQWEGMIFLFLHVLRKDEIPKCYSFNQEPNSTELSRWYIDDSENSIILLLGAHLTRIAWQHMRFLRMYFICGAQK